jgi:WD40 repeat protein
MLLAMNSPDQAADEAVPRIQPSAVLPRPPQGEDAEGCSFFFGPDGKHLYTLRWRLEQEKHPLECWEIRQAGKTVEAVRIWQKRKEIRFPQTVVISPDGKYLADYSRNAVLLFDPITGERMAALSANPPPTINAMEQYMHPCPMHLAFSPDSRWLAAIYKVMDLDALLPMRDKARVVYVWDVATKQTVRVWHLKDGGDLQRCAFSPDGKTLVITGGTDIDNLGRMERILVWNVATNQVNFWATNLQVLNNVELQKVYDLAAAKVKDKTLWIIVHGVGTMDKEGFPKSSGVVQVRDENGKVLYTRTTEGQLTSVAVSPNGRWFATGESKVKLYKSEVIRERGAYLWETETGKLLAILEGAGRVAVSPNGDWLAAAGEDGAVRLWKVPEAIR